ncbi:PREDICTED: THO complex subunit 4C-like [Ipomoea nil]|uniref:THO complex subunit 4C-like n=1 Tax=Ipomoea nil TaxID=35883 RepID=UPI0009009A76|nr:PREDICTED: THO complex subunit 4C-like [Ipomoea nil]
MVDIKKEPYRDSREPRAAGEQDHGTIRDGNRRFLFDFPEAFRGRVGYAEAVTKVYIYNLADSVSEDDLKTLFLEVGLLQSCSIYRDINGRPMGLGEVGFFEHSDAMTAMRIYNEIVLDGKPLKIEVGERVQPPRRANLFGYSGYEEESEPSSGNRLQDPQFRPPSPRHEVGRNKRVSYSEGSKKKSRGEWF